MRWRKVEGPSHVEDRRRPGRGSRRRRAAIGGLGILGLLAALLFGGGSGEFNVEDVFGQLSPSKHRRVRISRAHQTRTPSWSIS